jgi:hypothetical protein
VQHDQRLIVHILLHLEFAALVLALGLLLLMPAVAEARERARRSQCVNNLFQHGPGSCQWVVLDRTLQVISVSSRACHGGPCCTAAAFYREGPEFEHVAFCSVPGDSVRDAMMRLEQVYR